MKRAFKPHLTSLATKTSSRSDPKRPTELQVVVNSALHRCRTPTVAFPTVDLPCGSSKALVQDRTNILVPEPHGTLKGNFRATSHHIWISQERESKELSCCAVVVVPCDLDRTATVVVLPRLTRVYCASFAVPSSRYFFFVTKTFTEYPVLFLLTMNQMSQIIS